MSHPSHSPADGPPRGRLRTFFCAPASAVPLACLRISMAAILLAQGFTVRWGLGDLLGNRGIVEWKAVDRLHGPAFEPLWSLLRAFPAIHLDAGRLVGGMGVVYVASVAALGIGWRVRWTAPLAWCTHLGLMVIGRDVSYGVDNIANVALFYGIWMPVGQAVSLDVRAGRTAPGPSPEARFALRVLQLHLCIVYLASGAAKAAGIEWWNGEAIWRALMNPNYRQLDFSWLAAVRMAREAPLLDHACRGIRIPGPDLAGPDAHAGCPSRDRPPPRHRRGPGPLVLLRLHDRAGLVGVPGVRRTADAFVSDQGIGFCLSSLSIP